MKTQELLRKLGGIQTVESVKSALDIDRTKAIYYIHRLRKKGYVKTRYDPDKMRVYYISSENRLGGTSYLDILNRYSPIKLSSQEVYRIYGRKISIEETLIYAIKTRKFRYILASLALFRKITNWSDLYSLAKRNDLIREVGALHDLALIRVSKIRRMDKRFRNNALPKEIDIFKYIMPDLKSKDYQEIEKKWKIYIPFNERDLEGYIK